MTETAPHSSCAAWSHTPSSGRRCHPVGRTRFLPGLRLTSCGRVVIQPRRSFAWFLVLCHFHREEVWDRLITISGAVQIRGPVSGVVLVGGLSAADGDSLPDSLVPRLPAPRPPGIPRLAQGLAAHSCRCSQPSSRDYLTNTLSVLCPSASHFHTDTTDSTRRYIPVSRVSRGGQNLTDSRPAASPLVGSMG